MPLMVVVKRCLPVSTAFAIAAVLVPFPIVYCLLLGLKLRLVSLPLVSKHPKLPTHLPILHR